MTKRRTARTRTLAALTTAGLIGSGLVLAGAAPATAAPDCAALPAGSVTASASSSEGPFTANLAVDSDAQTRWGSSFADTEWLALDLGEERDICSVAIDWEAAYGRGYRVQVSDDGSNWTPRPP